MFLHENITIPTNGAVMTGGEGVVKVLSESPEWVGIAGAIVFAEKKTPWSNKAVFPSLQNAAKMLAVYLSAQIVEH